MTTTVSHEVSRRRRIRPKAQRITAAEDLRASILAQLEEATRLRWPSARYREDPVAFFREILGVEPWEKQVEIIEAVRDHPRVAVKSGHKVSKDLAHSTPVPTPSGWRLHGDLRPGDLVFAMDGSPTRVVSTTPYAGRPMMRVHFEDGTHIDCSETHEWVVRSRELRKKRNEDLPSVVLETREMFDHQTVPNGFHPDGRPRRISNWTVDLPAPLQQAERDLPLDPYLLGLWLGDGSKSSGLFTSADGLERAFEEGGFVVTNLRRRYQFYVRGLIPILRELDVLENKHIPERYLWASEEQRRALLEGLLDTDGTIDKRHRVAFTNTNERIADGVLQLARSLGIKARKSERRAVLGGRDCGPAWVVGWASPDTVFRLPRKQGRLRTDWEHKRNAHRRVAIERIERLGILQPTQCIEVEHASHLYLVGESMIPTHNSHSAAGIALWYYSSFPDARVVMSSTTARQVDQILWRELQMMRARGGRCVACKAEDPDGRRIPRPCPHGALIDGEIGGLARTGLKSDDFREIVGFTAREAEAVAGISGRHLLYIIDEASGVPDAIFEAIEGNRAGGARIVMFSNPTRTSGEFFEAFTKKSDFYKTITVSSEETPNVTSGQVLIPGLATREWIDEKRAEWGEESPLYKVRIQGEFATSEDGKIFSIHAIEQAEELWHETPAEGRLYVGIDPAGESGTGDEAVFAPRRGKKILELQAHLGLSPEAHLVHLLSMLGRLVQPRERPVVVLDREGAVGARVYGVLLAHLDTQRRNPPFELVGLKASDRAPRQPFVFDRMREEITANFEAWIRDGGTIPEDAKLAAEMHVWEWESQVSGRLKLIPSKKALRRQDSLGRSPDRYDAAALSCWEPLALRDGVPASARRPRQDADDFAEATLDPYAGSEAWR